MRPEGAGHLGAQRMKPPTALLALLLAACEPASYEPHGGPLYTSSCPLVYWCHPLMPPRFYTLPGCEGESFIAGEGEEVAYRSVMEAEVCVDENGEAPR